MEKILLTNNLHPQEILKSLACDGIPTFGLRVMNAYSLALYTLEKNNIYFDKVYLDKGTFALYFYKELLSLDYFKNFTINDARNLASSFASLKREALIPFDIELLRSGEFKEKNEAIIKAYNIYTSLLLNKNNMDDESVIEYVIKNNLHIDIPICKFNIFPLSPLEERLYESVSNTHEVINIEKKPLKIIDTYKCYGITNEIENIFIIIHNQNLKLDECVICVLDSTSYSKAISTFANVHSIPFTSSIKQSIFDTNPGKFFFSLIEFINDSFSARSLDKIISSSFFKKRHFLEEIGIERNKDLRVLIEASGNLRLNFNIKENEEKLAQAYGLIEEKTYNWLTKLAGILGQGIFGFIEDFCVSITPSDELALSLLANVLSIAGSIDLDPREVFDDVSNMLISSGAPEEGKLYVCDLLSLRSINRPNIFIVGLSSNYFPGQAKEDPIFLDSDYRLYGVENRSKQVILNKKKMMDDILTLASSRNACIYLSYSYYNSEDLKKQTQSSYIYELYKEIRGEDFSIDNLKNEIKTVQYFSSPLSKNSSIGKFLISNGEKLNKITFKEEIEDKDLVTINNLYFSPSSIEEFLACPLRFYLKNVLYLNEEFTISPTIALPANYLGSLVHSVMEEKASNIDDFLKIAKDKYHAYFITHKTLDLKAEKEFEDEFLEICANAFALAKNDGDTILKETDLSASHKTGITLHGLPDAYVRMNDGKMRIVDYKIKGSIEHKVNDIKSIIQVLIYAYILRANGYIVDECEYRYLRQKKSILITDVDAKLEELDKYLVEFSNALNTNAFNPCKNKKCQYCQFKASCNIEGEEDE